MRPLPCLGMVLGGVVCAALVVWRLSDQPLGAPTPVTTTNGSPNTAGIASDPVSASLRTTFAEAAFVALGQISRDSATAKVVFRPLEIWKGQWLADENGRGEVELTVPASGTLVGKAAILFKFRTHTVDAQRLMLVDGTHLAAVPDLTLDQLRRALQVASVPPDSAAPMLASQGWLRESRKLDEAVASAGLGPQPNATADFSNGAKLPSFSSGLMPTPAPVRTRSGEVDLSPKTLEESAQEAIADRLRRMFDGEHVTRGPQNRRPAKT